MEHSTIEVEVDPSAFMADDDIDQGDAREITEELLVEEISIDGMCGVY